MTNEPRSTPHRSPATPPPRRLTVAYRPDPYAFALWLVVAFGIVSTSTLWFNRIARRVDATCTWEAEKQEWSVPKCLVRTTGLFSSSEGIVYPAQAPMSPGGWFAVAESDFNGWTWSSLLFGDRIEFLDGCTDRMLLSAAPSGTRRQVEHEAAELNRFFREKGPEVRVSYGPWGFHPLVFALPFGLAVMAVVAGLRRGGRRIVVTIDEASQTVVIEDAFGPWRFERRDYLATGVTRCTVGKERPHQYFVELVLRSGQRVRLCVETGPRRVQEQFAARVEASLERVRALAE